MATFNELNVVEFLVIDELSGVDLNNNSTREYGDWKYLSKEDLDRDDLHEVLLEDQLRKSLIELNPFISEKPERADEVIYYLKNIIDDVKTKGLVKSNEEFLEWVLGNKTLPYGENNRHEVINFIDFENIDNNSFVITNQFKVSSLENKVPDLVMFINGIPMVVGEAKTPVRPSVTWLDGAVDIHDVYENTITKLFVPNILSYSVDGKNLFYGAVRTPIEFWSPWRLEENQNTISQNIGLSGVREEVTDLLSPKRLLDILRNFSLYTTNKQSKKIKIICRYQQYFGANSLIERVLENKTKQGLIWHFQGSGKSFLMIFAAQKLRRLKELKSPTVVVVVDRTDLDSQISGTFKASEVSNVETTDSIKELEDHLKSGTRKIIITMIHKFKDAYPNMNERDNVIVMVDEAHRTQEGDLGRKMRSALPNAFLFGLTGTPVNKADQNTFYAFGSTSDKGGYLSRYTFQDSLRDKATLPLHFEPRLMEYHIDSESLDEAFEELKVNNSLSDEQADALSKKASKMSIFLKAPKRVQEIAEDIRDHFLEKVDPNGFKAMIVTPDRFACVQYKEELDKHFDEDVSEVVISTSANDTLDFKQKWGVDKDKQDKIVERFNDKNSKLKFLIVTAKLLTGFDSPILQTMYIDKSLKDHTLLQAICRANRVAPNKDFGRIVDYFGIFDDAAKAFEFDDESITRIITNIDGLKDELPSAMQDCLEYFVGIDRSIVGFEGLENAQECLKTDDKKDEFAKSFVRLSKLWESISPDVFLNQYNQDYVWLSMVYESIKEQSENIGKLLWITLGEKTTKLIHENVKTKSIKTENTLILDEDLIDDILNKSKIPDEKEVNKIIKEIEGRLNNPHIKEFKDLSERLENLKNRAESGQVISIEFVKELCDLAKETLVAEKKYEELPSDIKAKNALTELFLEIKSDKTPKIIDEIVKKIDEVVTVVRFDSWQNTSEGEREVKKALRRTLFLYKLHKDHDLFSRAYDYIKEYY